jgi:hypothetical protein
MEPLLLIALLYLFRVTRAYIFFFSALSAEKKKMSPLRTLRL